MSLPTALHTSSHSACVYMHMCVSHTQPLTGTFRRHTSAGCTHMGLMPQVRVLHPWSHSWAHSMSHLHIHHRGYPCSSPCRHRLIRTHAQTARYQPWVQPSQSQTLTEFLTPSHIQSLMKETAHRKAAGEERSRQGMEQAAEGSPPRQSPHQHQRRKPSSKTQVRRECRKDSQARGCSKRELTGTGQGRSEPWPGRSLGSRLGEQRSQGTAEWQASWNDDACPPTLYCPERNTHMQALCQPARYEGCH